VAPEHELDFSTSYPGKKGKTARWLPTRPADRSGVIDLASYIQPKGYTTTYAICFVPSPEARQVQIRLGSNDWAKLWVNASLVLNSHPSFGRPVLLDDDVVPVILPKGVSRLLFSLA
jgi:hypothetical protein